MCQMCPLPFPRKGNGHLLFYTCSGEKPVYILCNEKWYNEGQEVEVKTFFTKELKGTVDKAKKKSTGYAEIPTSNNTKLKKLGQRILPPLSTKSLLAADFGHNKSCHYVCHSPKCNKKKNVEQNTSGQSTVDELLNLTEYLVVVKKEIYILAQLRGFLIRYLMIIPKYLIVLI